MAYLLNEEEEKQQQLGQSQPSANQLGQGQGQNVQQLIKKPQASGQFTNIQQFLQANQRTGQNIAEKIKSDTTKSTQNLTTTGLQNILQTKSQLEQDKEQDISAAQKLQSSAEQARQAVKQNDPLLKPQSQAFNPFANLAKEDEEQMYKITSGDTSNIQRGSQQFQTQVAQNLSDFGQQQQLLSQSLADPNLRSQLMTRSLKGGVGYTRGQEALDRSITDAIGGAILKQGIYSGLGTIGQASDEQTQVGQDFSRFAQDYLNWLTQTSKQSRDILSGLSKDVQSVTEKRKGEVEQDLTSAEQFMKDLSEGKFTLEDLSKIARGQAPSDSRLFNVFQATPLSEEELPIIKAKKTQEDVSNEIFRRANIRNKQQFDNLRSTYGLDHNEASLISEYSRYKIGLENSRGPNINLGDSSYEIERKRREYAEQVEKIKKRLSEIEKDSSFKSALDKMRMGVSKEWARDLRDRVADEQDIEFHEALVNRFLQQNLGLNLGSRLFDLNLGNIGQFSRENLLDRVRTQEEAATLNAINRLLSGSQAEQLDLQKSLGMLSNQMATGLTDRFKQAEQERYNKFLEDLAQREVWARGKSERGYDVRGTAYINALARANARDFFTNPENFKRWISKGEEIEQQVAFGGAANRDEAEQRALQNIEGFRQTLQPILAELGYNNTLKSRLRRK